MTDTQQSITGEFVAGGAECPLFRTDDGRGFSLAGLRHADAPVGAKATLWGTEVEFSTCQQGLTFSVERAQIDAQ